MMETRSDEDSGGRYRLLRAAFIRAAFLVRPLLCTERPDVSGLALDRAVGSSRGRQQKIGRITIMLLVCRLCRLAANVLFVNARGCGGSRGCWDVLSGRLGVVVRRWWGGGVGFDDEF